MTSNNNLLEVKAISKSFSGLRAVKELDFNVRSGEILGLIGPNGAGKTTLINLISGVIPSDHGEVLFCGKRVTGLPTHMLLRRGLARTFQSAVVYHSKTVRDNSLLGAFSLSYKGFWSSYLNTSAARKHRKSVEDNVDQLLKELQIDHLADEQADNLPYGHQKMLGLVIALAAKPKLLMLDEPAAGLNREEAQQVSELIRKINEGGTAIIVVDHNMQFISSICDRLLVLHHGEKLAMGTPSEITSNPDVIEAYLGKQGIKHGTA